MIEYLATLTEIEKKADTGSSSNESQSLSVSFLFDEGRLVTSSSLEEAVSQADIVQEQGPEKISFKQWVWREIETYAPSSALFWSSTSGILTSVQSTKMKDKSRLMILHPYNPPHVMPLLEIAVSAVQLPQYTGLDSTIEYWEKLGRKPVVLKEEVTGFVANRLAFALFREAAYLVERGVARAEDIDFIVQQSLGPRWAVKGPFWNYHAGGGEQLGLEGFFDKIGDTIQACWDSLGELNIKASGDDVDSTTGWQERVCKQVIEAYGNLGPKDLRERDKKLQDILNITMK